MKLQVHNFNLSNNTVQTMSSLEIAELTGKEHRNVLRDIRTMLEELYTEKGMLSFEHTYTNEQNGQQYKMYKLLKRETMILVSGYSVALRAKIVDRWQELEEAQTSNALVLPNFEDPAEAAIAWALQYKEKQLALQQLEVAKPKVEFVDKYVDRGNLRKITDVAKELGVSSRTLCKWLRDNDHMWKRTDKQLWKQAFIDKGYGEHKMTTVSSGKLETTTPLVTPVGDIFIKQNFNK